MEGSKCPVASICGETKLTFDETLWLGFYPPGLNSPALPSHAFLICPVLITNDMQGHKVKRANFTLKIHQVAASFSQFRLSTGLIYLVLGKGVYILTWKNGMSVPGPCPSP